LMINHGEEVLYGDLNQIKSRFKKHSVQVSTDEDFGNLPGVIEKRANKEGLELILAEDISPQTVLDQLRAQNISINHFEITTPSLHTIFLHMAGENHE
jgi:ABC-2 type transport system ATP-binding protein